MSMEYRGYALTVGEDGVCSARHAGTGDVTTGWSIGDLKRDIDKTYRPPGPKRPIRLTSSQPVCVARWRSHVWHDIEDLDPKDLPNGAAYAQRCEHCRAYRYLGETFHVVGYGKEG